MLCQHSADQSPGDAVSALPRQLHFALLLRAVPLHRRRTELDWHVTQLSQLHDVRRWLFSPRL